MRHLPATRLLPRLVLATCSAAAFAAIDVSLCQAQDAPTAAATEAPAAEPQPWQPQLAELREQLASLRQDLEELKSHPTPDAELEIKRLDEKIDLLRTLLSKPDAPSKADLDSLRDFLSLQDNLVERHGASEINRIDEKVDLFRETLIDRMNNYVWGFGIIGTVFVVLVTFFGRNTITAWIKQQIADTTEEKISKYVETELKQQGEKEITQLLEEFKTRSQKILDDYTTLQNKLERVIARHETRLFDSPETPEEKAVVKELARELTEIKGTSEYTGKEWFLRGLAASSNEDWEQAYRFYSAAVEKDPLKAVVYSNRGNMLRKLERKDEALADYAKAIELKPDYALAYNNRGITLHELGRYEESLADYAKAIELKPDYTAAYNNRGITLSKLQCHDEALADYAKAIELNPDYAPVYYNRGYTLAKLERYDEALADFAKAITIEPNIAYAYYGRGDALVKMGRYEEALTEFTKVIELEQDHVSAYLSAAEVQILIDKPDLAMASLISATPHLQKANDRAVLSWLTCIATSLLGNDTTAADAAFAAEVKEDFKRTCSTDDIEGWLEKVELDDDVRRYIREKTEQFKAH